jgi:hypothetical protein
MKIVMKAVVTLFALGFSAAAFSYTAAPEPDNLDTLVQLSDVVIVGTLEQIKDSRTFYGYQSNAEELKRLNEAANVDFGVPYTDYVIKAERLLKAPRTAFSGNRLVVRMLPDYVPDVAAANAVIKSKRKAKQVFFLRLNPDGETYGIFTELGIMDIKQQNAAGERLVYRADGRERTPFGLDEEAETVLQRIESLAGGAIR